MLAATEPMLTLEFINEWFVGFAKASGPERYLCLDYVSPWLPNLATFGRRFGDRAIRTKLEKMVKLLIETTVAHPDVGLVQEKYRLVD